MNNNSEEVVALRQLTAERCTVINAISDRIVDLLLRELPDPYEQQICLRAMLQSHEDAHGFRIQKQVKLQ